MKWTVVDITPNHSTKVKAPYEIQQEGNVWVNCSSWETQHRLLQAGRFAQFHKSIHTKGQTLFLTTDVNTSDRPCSPPLTLNSKSCFCTFRVQKVNYHHLSTLNGAMLYRIKKQNQKTSALSSQISVLCVNVPGQLLIPMRSPQ